MTLNPQAELLWDKIRNPNCTDCALHENAQTVCLVGDGPVPARYMIIGEAPGFREDDVQKPFAGKSGRLLDETLEKYGLSRDQAFVTNVAKCRPPENRTPNRTEFKACRHYLEEEIEAVKPEYMLLLGNSALSTIKKSGIMRHRGEVYEYNGSKVFASVHPAAVLRNPHYARVFESDISTFSRLVRGEPGAAATRVFLVRDAKTLSALCKAILTSEAVAYDLETNGFEEKAPDSAIATIAIAVKPGVAFVVPIHHTQSPFKDPQRVLSIVGNALLYSKAHKIAHNAKFDDRWLNQFGVPIHADFDTMVAAHILDENRLKGLKPLAQMLLGVDPWKDVDLSDGGAMTAPLSSLARYNAKDADYTLRLYYLFRQELMSPELRRTSRIFLKLLMPASAALTDIERTGLHLDLKRLAERRIEVQEKLSKIDTMLTKALGRKGNWNSTITIAELLFEKRGLDVLETTKGGKPSTRESVLLRLAHEDQTAKLVLLWRKWAKYESTYLSTWTSKQINGRIYPNYKLTGTVTGRLSSGKLEGDKGRGLNVQQVPRDGFIRSIIGAPPGWKLVEADYSQMELRIAAHLSQDPVMMRTFQMSGDIHLTTAMQITGKPAQGIEKEERKKAKGVNFGYVFGMGWFKFIEYARDSYDVIVSESEAKDFRERFFNTYKRLRPWHERQRRLVRQYKRVQSPIGRVRHLPDVESQDKEVQQEAERQAINSPVQSMASDMMLLALVLLHDRMDPTEARIVGSIHDEILFEIREDVVAKWVPIIKGIMEHLPLKKKFGAELTVPIVVDIAVRTHWGEDEAVA